MKFDESIVANVMKDVVNADQAPTILDRPFEYSATVLCKSPRQVQLERRYKDKIASREFQNKWYSFFGNAVHLPFYDNELHRPSKYHSETQE